MPIDRRDIAHVADLARLELAEGELDELVRDCQAILEHFETLREVDLPNTHAVEEGREAEGPPRERSGPDPLHLPPEEIAPAWVDGFFVLPRLPALDHDDEPL